MVMGRPPFNEATKNDILFKSQAISHRPDMFWKMHFRNNNVNKNVSEEFKNLINQMFKTLEPKDRPSLKDISQHSWMEKEDDNMTSEVIIREFRERYSTFKANH